VSRGDLSIARHDVASRVVTREDSGTMADGEPRAGSAEAIAADGLLGAISVD